MKISKRGFKCDSPKVPAAFFLSIPEIWVQTHAEFHVAWTMLQQAVSLKPSWQPPALRHHTAEDGL